MKVLTGTLKGREIRFKPMPGVRPTADKIRKAMVDTLRHKLPDARVLDLYAGSGAIGFETLSNGASSVLFVESDRARWRLICDTASALGLQEACRVEREDALSAVTRLSREGCKYDLIFADPPYQSGEAVRIVNALAASTLLAPEGIAVVECSSGTKLPSGPIEAGSLRILRSREYGGSKVVYLAAGD